MSSADVSEVINPEGLITYIFPDFHAIRHFQRDFINNNEFHLVEESISSGFDIYLVEQWVLNRKIGTIISTYTGNVDSSVAVIKFTVLKKPTKNFPVRFQEYLNELMLNHAKVKKMDSDLQMGPKELLFVTNSAALPSNLNLIPIPTGDLRLLENDFMVNSNLKKLQCSGRSLSLFTSKVSGANEDKFRHVYKIYNVNVPIKFAIKELVNIIQICLFYFDLLDAKYCDGLLCNKTEESIIEWWNLIGLPHYNFKPNIRNGILPSRTVAALISIVLSVKIRLQMIGGCDVPKDPFDFENFMLSIGQFQKQYKLDKLRKLDLQTLNKLFTITNSKIIPDKPVLNYDTDDSQSDNLLNPMTINTGLASPYKKNRNYYSKEFKKFTNAVKSTVQDRIIASNKDTDDQNMNPKSSNRIRSRIAKLAENVSPLEVETLDLEILVHGYLIGKILQRLWFGTYQPGPSEQINHQSQEYGTHKNQHHHHHHHQHHQHHHRHHGAASNHDSKSYKFVSLKEAISNAQAFPYYANPSSSITDVSRYYRGFNKMKLGLQGKILVSNNQQKKHRLALQVTDEANDSNLNSRENSSCLLDSLLTPNDICPQFDSRSDKSSTHSKSDKNYLSKFNKTINRRNSFPFVDRQGETNLNVLEFLRHEEEFEAFNHPLKKSLSSSLLEDYFCFKSEKPVFSIEKLSYNYLRDVNNLIKIEGIEKNNNKEPIRDIVTTQKIENLYNKLNHEVVTFSHVHNQSIQFKNKILQGDLVSNLSYNIDDLSATVDRLVYEIRIVGKRINEFEEYSNLFDAKLNTQTMNKVSTMIDNLILLNRFNRTFEDENERNSIIAELTGNSAERIELSKGPKSKKESLLGMFIIFICELVSCIIRTFNLDGSKMNFDRIRLTWKKVDPNRKYTDKIYSVIGKESSKTSIASNITGKKKA